MADDYGSSTSNYGTLNTANLSVGGTVSISGTIEQQSDHDWFKVSLNAGYTYEITAIDNGVGDPYLSVYNSSGGLIIDKHPNSDGDNGNITIQYSPTSTGTYYLGVEDYLNTGTGGYQISVKLQSIQPDRHAPAGTDKTIILNEDTSYTIKVADFGFSDSNDSPPHQFTAVQIGNLPGFGRFTFNGNLVTFGQLITVSDINAGKLIFTPAPNAHANGTKYGSFTFKVQDSGSTGSNLALTENRMSFNVNAVNDAPTGADKTLTINEDTSYTIKVADFGFSDSNDTPANNFTVVKIATLPNAGSLKLNGSTLWVGATINVTDINANRLLFTPAANANGVNYANFTFQVQDDGGTANGGINLDATPNSLNFNVTAIDDPTIGTVMISGEAEMGKILSVNNTLYDGDGLGSITYTWKNGASVLGTGASYTLTESNLGQSLTVTASYVDGSGRAGSVTSAATAAVSLNKTALAVNTAGDKVYISSGINGLQIKSWANLNGPVLGSYNTPGNAHDIALATISYGGSAHTVAVVADDQSGVQILDVTTSSTPTLLSTLDTPGTALGVVISADNYAYVADGASGVQIVDLLDPIRPVAKMIDTPGVAKDIGVMKSSGKTYLYVADAGSGIQVIDATYPNLAKVVGSYNTQGVAYSVAINGQYAYVADRVQGLLILNISTPTNPTLVASYDTAGIAFDLTVVGTTVYVADGASGIQALDITNPSTPRLFRTISTSFPATNITVSGDYALVQNEGLVQAISILNTPPTPPTISGISKPGQTLTAINLSDTDVIRPETLTYIWKNGATELGRGNTYTPKNTDAGKTITVTATYTDQGGTVEYVTSTAFGPIASNELPSGQVTISGTSKPGQVLSASHNLNDPNIIRPETFAYIWKSGATELGRGNTYTPKNTDTGKTITVTATYTDQGNTVEYVASTAFGPISPNEGPIGTVTISNPGYTGTLAQGQILSATNNLTDPNIIRPETLTYVWKSGATELGRGATLKLTSANVGQIITATATYTDQGNTVEYVASSPTSSVRGNVSPEGNVQIVLVGQSLNVQHNLIDDNGLGAITYTWTRRMSDVGTGSSYTLNPSVDIIGTSFYVTARYVDGAGTREEVVSPVYVYEPSTPGVTITPLGTNNTSELLGTAQFSVLLNKQPTDNVTINFVSTNAAEGRPTVATLTFTNANWNIAQRLTIQGVDDAPNDVYEPGGTTYQITGTVTSNDINYTRGIVITALNLLNQDDPLDEPIVWTGDNTRNDKYGGNGADILSGEGDIDYLHGGRGDDRLNGGNDDDKLYGEDGNDRLNGDNGFDTLDGGAGNDILSGVNDDDMLLGRDGNDELNGDNGLDNLNGGAGADVLNGGEQNDQLDGGDGDDQLYGQGGMDTLLGAAGNDSLDGGTGIDFMDGGTGNDRYQIDESTDTVSDSGPSSDIDVVMIPGIFSYTLGASMENGTLSGAGNGTLTGNIGRNTLTGNAGNNLLNGIAGNDTLIGGPGNDTLQGGADMDSVYYSSAPVAVNANLITGVATGDGDDLLTEIENILGGFGNDTLIGNSVTNYLVGGEGNDTINGGMGKDMLTGNTGADIFIYNTLAESGIGAAACDVIQDFSSAQGDKIDLHLIGAKSFIAGNFTNHTGEVRFDSVNHLLQFDSNGDAIANFEIELTGVTQFSAADLIL